MKTTRWATCRDQAIANELSRIIIENRGNVARIARSLQADPSFVRYAIRRYKVETVLQRARAENQ